MRTYLLFVYSFVLSTQSASSQSLRISHLAGDGYVYTTYQDYQGVSVPSNSMYIVTSEGIVLIDTPWDTTQLRPLVDSVWNRHRKKIVASVSTHFHEDRVAGVEYLESIGVKTYASAETIRQCKLIGSPAPAHGFLKDTTFQFGETRLQTFYPGGGHTIDNIVVWYDKEQVLFGGCFIKSVEARGLGNIADADLKSWPASVERLMKKFPSRAFVIPGHDSWIDPKSPEHTILLLKQYKNK